MSFTVNTNVTSLQAQNNLQQSQNQLNTAIERLSSGSKINSAADNAAGQAIANRMSAQINGLNQASSNANDGISLAQTAEGALNQVNSNLQSIRTLTVQAQNGTNSASDLKSIQDEITQRLNEINRVSSQTQFNGKNILDGSQTSVKIQVGSNDNQTISLSLQNVDATSLSLNGFHVTGNQSATAADVVGDAKGGSKVTVGGSTYTFNATSSSWSSGTGASATTLNNSDMTSKIDAATGGATAVVSGKSYTIATGGTSVTATTGGATVFQSSGALTTSTTGAATANPLKTLDAAISQIDKFRSNLGAVQNRLNSAINNISSTTTNLSSARSRIQDTNYASEVSALSKAKILQQAGTSVLSQANSTNKGVITLLQNA